MCVNTLENGLTIILNETEKDARLTMLRMMIKITKTTLRMELLAEACRISVWAREGEIEVGTSVVETFETN